LTVQTQGCGPKDRDRILKAARHIVERCDWEYREATFSACIRERAENATVICEYCEDPHLLGYNRWYGPSWKNYKLHASEEIHLCVNQEKMALDDGLLEDVMVHEWAHSCCWQHGMGIYPGNDGTL
jgi:hypothetical protein